MKITKVVSGEAKGADLLGKLYAKERDIPYVGYKPDWNQYGLSAGYKRNILIVNDSEIIVAAWDGVSKGTAHSISIAKSQNKQVIVVSP